MLIELQIIIIRFDIIWILLIPNEFLLTTHYIRDIMSILFIANNGQMLLLSKCASDAQAHSVWLNSDSYPYAISGRYRILTLYISDIIITRCQSALFIRRA